MDPHYYNVPTEAIEPLGQLVVIAAKVEDAARMLHEFWRLNEAYDAGYTPDVSQRCRDLGRFGKQINEPRLQKWARRARRSMSTRNTLFHASYFHFATKDRWVPAWRDARDGRLVTPEPFDVQRVKQLVQQLELIYNEGSSLWGEYMDMLEKTRAAKLAAESVAPGEPPTE